MVMLQYVANMWNTYRLCPSREAMRILWHYCWIELSIKGKTLLESLGCKKHDERWATLLGYWVWRCPICCITGWHWKACPGDDSQDAQLTLIWDKGFLGWLLDDSGYARRNLMVWTSPFVKMICYLIFLLYDTSRTPPQIGPDRLAFSNYIIII